jgi:hypothetical protein
MNDPDVRASVEAWDSARPASNDAGDSRPSLTASFRVASSAPSSAGISTSVPLRLA